MWVCTRYNSKHNINHHFLEWFLSKGRKQHKNTATATVPTAIRLPLKAIFISHKEQSSVKQTLPHLVDYNHFWATNTHILTDRDKGDFSNLTFLLWGPGEPDHPVLKTLKTNPANPPFLALIREPESQSLASDRRATATPARWDVFPRTYWDESYWFHLPAWNPKFPKLCQSLSVTHKCTHFVFFSELFVQPLKWDRGRILSNPWDAHGLFRLLLSAPDLWSCGIWAQPHTQLQRGGGG